MANLRTNNLSGEQGQNAYRGSVHFPQVHNSTDYLVLDPSLNPANQFNFLHNGTTDFTIEFWIHPKQGNNRQTVFSTGGNSSVIGFAVRIMEDGASGGSNGYKVLCQFSRGSSGNYLGFLGGNIDNKGYSHVALVFTTSNKQLAIYINGQLTNSSDLDGTAEGTFGSGDFSQGNHGNSGTFGREPSTANLYLHQAHLSNFRIVKGKTVYTANFTPPQSELTVIDGTILLAFQDSTDPTKEATGQIINAYGQLASPDQFKILKHVPPVGRDAGNTFGGPIQQSSQGYMYFPTGGTVERAMVNNNFGARGLIMGGITYPGTSYVNTIEKIQIATLGNSADFGDLTNKPNGGGGFSSKIRGFVVGGNTPEGYGINVIQFVTIATEGNATDFGDAGYSRANARGVSNNTRGVYSGGESASSPNPSLNNIEFVTMSTAGNGQDFGDLIDAGSSYATASSPTRGVNLGGYRDGEVNFIDFITIATTGNSQQFGDLVNTSRNGNGGASNGHRGIVMGGYASPARTNTIQYVTIQSTGNAIDFGDLTDARDPAVTSSLTRGIACTGDYPSNVNIIDFIEIMTTANAVDFGDMTTKTSSAQTCSNAHGGLADDM